MCDDRFRFLKNTCFNLGETLLEPVGHLRYFFDVTDKVLHVTFLTLRQGQMALATLLF